MRDKPTLTTKPHELHLVSRDASNIAGAAGALFMPRCLDDVVSIVSDCRRRNVPFVARGAGTGLAGSSSTRRRSCRVDDVDESDP